MIEQREKNLLSLRKQKIDEIIFSKRLRKNFNPSQNNGYINCRHLLSKESFDKLNPELVKIFSTDELQLKTNFVRIKLIKYSLYNYLNAAN
jgi:hypothetical protein